VYGKTEVLKKDEFKFEFEGHRYWANVKAEMDFQFYFQYRLMQIIIKIQLTKKWLE